MPKGDDKTGLSARGFLVRPGRKTHRPGVPARSRGVLARFCGWTGGSWRPFL